MLPEGPRAGVAAAAAARGLHGGGRRRAPRSLRPEGAAEEAPCVPSARDGRSPEQPGRCLADVPAAPVRECGASRARARL